MYERAMSGAEKIDHEVCVNELFTFVTIHPNKWKKTKQNKKKQKKIKNW